MALTVATADDGSNEATTCAVGTFETCPIILARPFTGVDRKSRGPVERRELTHSRHLLAISPLQIYRPDWQRRSGRSLGIIHEEGTQYRAARYPLSV